MIVDDCPTTRKLLGLYLRAKGYEAVFAENGLDAIEKIGRNNINLIITDLNMPYMDGIELVKNLKADDDLKKIPILMVTTESDEEEKKKAFEAGVSGYLTKPVTAEMVSQNIKRILKEFFAEIH